MGSRAGLGIVPKPNPLSLDQLKEKFPKKKNSITQEAVDLINSALYDPEFDTSTLLNDMLTFENVMHQHSLSLEEYVDAVRYCAYLQSNPDSKLDAYKKTFSRREFVESRWNAQPGTSDYKALTAAATRYDALPYITKIKTQAMVPLHILFSGLQYQAISVLATEMTTAQLARDRISAAKELLAAVKAPENIKIDLDVGVKENTAIQSLNDQLAEIASRQMLHLQAGTATLEQFGAMKPKGKIIDIEVHNE